MNNRKLVSVITGTYDRPKLLQQCIGEVRKQTYPNIEHCIVHDGPASDDVKAVMKQALSVSENRVPIKWVETGRQWSQFLASSISAVPYQVAQWLASGDYLMWLADDEEMTPDHIESLVDLLEQEDVDFVYSQTEVWFNIGRSVKPTIIGAKVPKCGNITEALYRVELLDYCGFNTHVGSGTDWNQIETWMAAGASWAFLPRVTHSHRVDKMGDANLNNTRKILRGNKHDNITINAESEIKVASGNS